MERIGKLSPLNSRSVRKGHVMSPGSFATHQQHSNDDVEILYILKAKSIWPMQCQCYQFSEICNLFTSYHMLLLG